MVAMRCPSAVRRFVARFALGLLSWTLAVSVSADDKPPTRIDAFGDPLPLEAVARLGTVRFRHASYIFGIAFTPDGKAIISAGWDGVRVWDAATGLPLRKFAANAPLSRAVLSPDGRRLLLSGRSDFGSPLEVWDAATGKLIHKLDGLREAVLDYSADGKRIAAFGKVGYNEMSGWGKGVFWKLEIWNAITGKLESELDLLPEQVQSLTFAKDGKTLFLGSGGKTISIRDATNGKEIRRLRDVPADVHTLVLSPDGRRAAFIELETKKSPAKEIGGTRVFLCDLRSGAEQRRWTVPAEYDPIGRLKNGFLGLAFSPCAKRARRNCGSSAKSPSQPAARPWHRSPTWR
jgi:WD40 repeat protein